MAQQHPDGPAERATYRSPVLQELGAQGAEGGPFASNLENGTCYPMVPS